MFEDRVFTIAFLISAAVHGIVLMNNSGLGLIFFSSSKRDKKIEVAYLKPKEEETKRQELVAKQEPPKEAPLKLAPRTSAQKAPPPFVDKNNIFVRNKEIFSQRPPIAKPYVPGSDTAAVKKKVTLPALDIDKINNLSYISYYQIVREKIRRSAYHNYTSTDTGEIRVSFIVSRLGYLEEVRLIEDASSESQFLREIAVKSIKDASPFPKFPQELDYPQLPFNVIISFEVE